MNKYKLISYLTTLMVVIITILCVLLLKDIKYDYDFEHFQSSSDSDTKFFHHFRSVFESDNDFVLIGIENNQGVFNKNFLTKLDSFANAVATVPDIDTVITPTRLYEWRKNFKIPYLRFDSAQYLQIDSIRVSHAPELKGTTFSKDGKSILLYLKTVPYLSKVRCDSLARRLQILTSKYNFDTFHLAGRSIAQVYYLDLMSKELKLFMLASFVLVTLFLALAFRSIWVVIVSNLVVLLSIVWVLGFMVVLNKPINMVLTMMPTIIFVVGMSDVVHIMSKYLGELRKRTPKTEAIKKSFKEIGSATFFTSLTTAIGFITLLLSPIKPIRNFGIITAIGVFIAFFITYTLLPSMMVLLKPPLVIKKRTVNRWRRFLGNLFIIILRNRKSIIISSIILLLVSIFFAKNINVNNYLLEGLTEKSSLRQEFNYFEDNFSGVRPFEMAIQTKDTSKNIYNYSVLCEIDKLENYLDSAYELGAIISPSKIVKVANRSLSGGGSRFYLIPESKNRLQTIVRRLKKSNSMKILVDSTLRTGRLSGKMKDMGLQEIEKRDKKLKEFYLTRIDTSLLSYKLTGTAVLIDKNNQYISVSMIKSIGIAFIIVAIIVGFLFKSSRMIVISLIPNIIPLIFMAGIMGCFNMNLKITNSIIFSIAFGIAVDDTIHFLSTFRMALKNNQNVLYALKRTYLSTGKAIILTSIILSGGFLTLLFSDFMGTFQIGMLIGITLVIALLCDLLLLPILILLIYKKTTKN